MKSTKKIISLILTIAILIASLSACGASNTANTANNANQNTNAETNQNTNTETPATPATVRIGSLTGPTTIGLVKLLSDADEKKTENTYEYTIAGSADELTPLMIKGELDVLAGPANLAAVLNAKTEGKIQLLEITTLGVLYILSADENVKTWEDLKGKTIYATGKGSVPEYALNFLLKSNGLDPEKDVTIEFKSEPAEILSLYEASGNATDTIMMLPQPFATAAQVKFANLTTAFNLSEEWDKLGQDSKMITACLMVRSEFAEQNPGAIEILKKEFAASAEWVNGNTDEAAKLVEKYIGVKEGVAKKAIPLCNIVAISGEEMQKSAESYLKVLFEQNPAAVGGKLPADDFYYTGK